MINQIMKSQLISGLVKGDGGQQGVQRSIRLHLIVGLTVVLVLAGGLGVLPALERASRPLPRDRKKHPQFG